MDVPSARELELESLLRQRDVRIAELNDEISNLGRHLASHRQPGSPTDALTLPPTLLAFLYSHIPRSAEPPGPASGVSGSNSVTVALTHRVKLLQEENDELYSLLRHNETGKLKEQVKGLSRVVSRLEGALQESHSMMKSLSVELDKANEVIQLQQSANTPNSAAHSPAMSRPGLPSTSPHYSQSPVDHSSKPPPTGPRAQKRPRLSSPSLPGHSSNHRSHHIASRGESHSSRSSPHQRDKPHSNDIGQSVPNKNRYSNRHASPPSHRARAESNGMDIDSRPRSHGHELDDDRESSYGSRQRRRSPPGHERSRRSTGLSSRRLPRGGNGSAHHGPGDRGLAERMGL